MSQDLLQRSRLAFKRSFAAYYLDLLSPTIADPTAAFETCHEYLSALLAQLGREEFMRRLDDETSHLAGQIEQDMRRHHRHDQAALEYEDVEDRVRECFEYAVGRLSGQLGIGI